MRFSAGAPEKHSRRRQKIVSANPDDAVAESQESKPGLQVEGSASLYPLSFRAKLISQWSVSSRMKNRTRKLSSEQQFEKEVVARASRVSEEARVGLTFCHWLKAELAGGRELASDQIGRKWGKN